MYAHNFQDLSGNSRGLKFRLLQYKHPGNKLNIFYGYHMKSKYNFTIIAEIRARLLANTCIFIINKDIQTHEFVMYVMWQRARAGYLTIYYDRKKTN